MGTHWGHGVTLGTRGDTGGHPGVTWDMEGDTGGTSAGATQARPTSARGGPCPVLAGGDLGVTQRVTQGQQPPLSPSALPDRCPPLSPPPPRVPPCHPFPVLPPHVSSPSMSPLCVPHIPTHVPKPPHLIPRHLVLCHPAVCRLLSHPQGHRCEDKDRPQWGHSSHCSPTGAQGGTGSPWCPQCVPWHLPGVPSCPTGDVPCPVSSLPRVSPMRPHSPLCRTLAVVPASRWVLLVTLATGLGTASTYHPRPHRWGRASRVGTVPPCHPQGPQERRRGPLPPLGSQSHSQSPNVPLSVPMPPLGHVTHGVPSHPQGPLASLNTPKVDSGVRAPPPSLTRPPPGPAATVAGPRPPLGPPALETGDRVTPGSPALGTGRV